MPYSPDDTRYVHLALTRVESNPQRRKQPGGSPPPPTRGGRKKFGTELGRRLDFLIDEVSARPKSSINITPHLVFRVPLAQDASQKIIAELLEQVGIQVVSYEPDRAVIAFREDSNLS